VKSVLFRLTVVIVNMLLTTLAMANDNDDVVAAAQGLYAALSSNDVDGLAAYLPPEGFTEFNTTDSTLQKLNAAIFRDVMQSGVKIQLQVTDTTVRLFADTALVTGYRVGSIVMPNGQRLEGKQFLTMLWMKRTTGWKLAHIHLSTPAN
jgi:ketosteroid isomerase-like protein